jgi:hypothetical protein
MFKFRPFFLVVISLSLLLSACGGQQENHDDMTTPAQKSDVVYESGAWRTMTLTDARTKTEFKLSDHSGRVVILEMMDPGCPICKDQLQEIAAALEILGDKAVAVSVDIGYKGESALVKWAETNNATWSVAFISREFSEALVTEFGGEVVYPGNTPVIIIDPSGAAHVTDPGIKKAATLVELVNQWTQ